MSDDELAPRPTINSAVVSVARFLGSTHAEGPGERTAVWVQGCAIRCPGCFNPHMWSFRGGEQVATDDLVTRILDSGTAGLTLLGGEPFDQAAALSKVTRAVRSASRSVMTFTGYTEAQLRQAIEAGRADVAALLGETDLLVAGPFLNDRIDPVRPWVGSTNQEFVVLSDRFPHLLDHLRRTPDRVEINVDTSGQIAINGWAELELLDELLAPVARPLRNR
ncbi:4Fe-4S single cluster domain-containing protein [Micromonospora sp. WMMD729]|uniref:4Fe-4S single cluster domain-containing protein n=1 Tax=Micromonospora sp. WMMD729 TaxID=3404127 RepID=UPI003BF58168